MNSLPDRLGLCCITELYRDRGPMWRFRTVTRTTITRLEDRVQQWLAIRDIVIHNLHVARNIVGSLKDNGIKHYRLSSSMLPLIGEETLGFGVSDLIADEDVMEALDQLASIIRNTGVTISSHPGQYTVLPSENEDTVRRAITDLEIHGWLHSALGLPENHTNPINIHVGLSNGDPGEIRARFLNAYNKLSHRVQRRLVLENDDKGQWNCEQLYNYFVDKLPLTFDNLHADCNPSTAGNNAYWARMFRSTWVDARPVFHWSEGVAGDWWVRKHADYFTHIPDVVKKHRDVTWECEVKAKDRAILALHGEEQLNIK